MKKKVRLGNLAGLVSHVPAFLEPMSKEELRLWEGDTLNRLTIEEDKPAPMPRPAHRDDCTERTFDDKGAWAILHWFRLIVTGSVERVATRLICLSSADARSGRWRDVKALFFTWIGLRV